jgi:hypothetical protein
VQQISPQRCESETLDTCTEAPQVFALRASSLVAVMSTGKLGANKERLG